MVNLLLILI